MEDAPTSNATRPLAEVLRRLADEVGDATGDFSRMEIVKSGDDYYVARTYNLVGDDFDAYHLETS